MIIANDLHLADHPPLGRKPGYREEGLAMLDELLTMADERACPLILTGDVFHLKRPAFVSHQLVADIIATVQGHFTRVYSIVGNHDMNPQGDTEGQPLDVLYTSGAFRRDFETACVLEFGQQCAIFVRDYSATRDADPTYYALTEEELAASRGRFTLLLAHGSLVPMGEVRPYPHVDVSLLDWSGIDMICSGHIHEDLGIHYLQEGPLRPIRVFANVGAIGRTQRTEANLTRTVKAIYVSNTGQKLSITELPLKSALPADSIFYLPAAPNQDGDAPKPLLDQGSMRLEYIDTDVILSGLDVPADIRDFVKELLEYAEAEVSTS